jgi:hypothetical protein
MSAYIAEIRIQTGKPRKQSVNVNFEFRACNKIKSMSKKRDWFWQIKEMGQGPDYVFIATFDPSDAKHLAEVVDYHLPSGFVHNQDFINSDRRSSCIIYKDYLDQHTYDRLVAMKEDGEQKNIWYNSEIEVCNHQFMIENVLAGGMYGETELMIALAKSPDLTLQEWKVAYSGYSWGEVACGTSAASLLDYLHYEE